MPAPADIHQVDPGSSRRGSASRGARAVEQLVQDIRYAVRGLRKAPGFALTVILVLSLGVGANAAMFSLVDHLFFREPSGIVDPASVVTASEVFPGGYAPSMQPDLLDAIRTSVTGLATVATDAFMFQGIDRATGPRVFRVTSNYFSMLGVRMFRGRPFTAEEGADSAHVAIVSYPYWQRTLHGDSAVLGQSIELVKQRYTVVGIAAPDFTGTTLEATDLWLPLSPHAEGAPIMRLHPGVTPARAEAAMTVALNRVRPPRPGSAFRPSIATSSLVFGRDDRAGANPRLTIIVRVADVAGIILLIAIANVATLLLMRATRRRHEIAVRLALGVSRGRLVRQLLVEGVLLSVVAAGAGILAGVWGGAIARAEFMPFYRLSYPLLDWRFVGFTVGIAIAAGVLASLAPALRASRPNLVQSLKAADNSRRRRSWLQATLIVAQGALSVVLVVGAGLFVQSVRRIHDVPLGIDVDPLMFAAAGFEQRNDVVTFLPNLQQEVQRLRSIPGVQGAALAQFAPLTGLISGKFIRPDGDTLQVTANGKGVGLAGNTVSPGYFRTVGVRVVDGRDFTLADTSAKQPHLVVSETFARLAWPGRRAVGQCLKWGRPSNPCADVVGVVSDAVLVGVKPRADATFYMPILEMPPRGGATIVVNADAATRSTVAATLRRDLRALLPASTSLRIGDLKTQLDPQYAQWTEGAAVFSVMGLLALIVSAIGMYSVISYSISQRMREMGVRVALGARRAQVMRPVLLGGMKLAVIGVVIGIGASLALGKLVASLLYNTSARDPVSLVGAGVVLLIAAFLAALLPARRAARADPMHALQAE